MDSEKSDIAGGLVLRGVVAVLFGIAAVFWPGITLMTLLYLFSAFLLVGGLFGLIVGIGRLGRSDTSVWMRILAPLLGLLEIGVGVYLLRHPNVTFATFILLIGFVLIVRGVFEIVEGLFSGAAGSYRAIMVIVGMLAILAGVVVLFQPAASGVAFVWIVGLYSLVVGALMLASAYEIHHTKHKQRIVASETPKRR